MKKLHLCAGDIYLDGYINIDIHGLDSTMVSNEVLEANKTTLENYFKYPFIEDPVERVKKKRPFVIDKQMNVLNTWDFENESIDEIVMISCIEHFNPKTELPIIITEINRVMKSAGKLIIDWPDLKAQMDMYYGVNDEFLMELIYCNHKNQYAIHHWGFTKNTFPKLLGADWEYEFKQIVKHDYPMQGCVAIKK